MIKTRKGNRFSVNDRRAKALLDVADAAKEWFRTKEIAVLAGLLPRLNKKVTLKRIFVLWKDHMRAEKRLARAVVKWIQLGG